MQPSLPQSDANPAERQRRLARCRERYRYNYELVPPLAMVDPLPVSELPRPKWALKVLDEGLKILENSIENDPDRERREKRRKKRRRHRYKSLLTLGKILFTDGAEKAIGELLNDIREGGAQGEGRALKDYDDLFQTIGLPAIAGTFQDDSSFARLRVAGPNPLVIQRMKGQRDDFPVTDGIFKAQPGFENDSLAAALAEGRLYLADYRELAGLPPGDRPHGPKFSFAPKALFARPSAATALVPIAIQTGQTPGPANPIFDPRQDEAWEMAKTAVEIADGIHHEMISHLGRTHLLLEPYIIATHRQLPVNHPLFVLLDAHFEGTLFINDAAQAKLISTGGPVDLLLGASLDASKTLAVNSVREHSLEEGYLFTELKARGVDDSAALPYYPYRDDAILVWQAIRRWVESYLRIYYHGDEDVAADTELLSWTTELLSHDGGRMRAFGPSGRLTTFAELAESMTMLIFTASAQHAAVNFPQKGIMSYTPAMPLAGYRATPGSSDGLTEADWLAMLPPLDMAELQLQVLYLLGGVYYTRLGDYRKRQFKDDRVKPLLRAFQSELAQVEATIGERNRSREVYQYLLPSHIPQSTNI